MTSFSMIHALLSPFWFPVGSRSLRWIVKFPSNADSLVLNARSELGVTVRRERQWDDAGLNPMCTVLIFFSVIGAVVGCIKFKVVA